MERTLSKLLETDGKACLKRKSFYYPGYLLSLFVKGIPDEQKAASRKTFR
jgi:hypothetical protein